MRILVVEDEARIAAAVAESMEAQGWHVERAADIGPARTLAGEQSFDAVVLDWNLPSGSGLELLKQWRAAGLRMPVIILTARDTTEERVAGLDAGADDYLAKPFAMAELVARVRALLRRGQIETSQLLKYATIDVDVRRRRATREGKLLDLTAKEFELLALLAENAPATVSRETVARVVWNEMPRATPLDNVIDVHMGRLRRKVDDPFSTRLIQTVRGVGFALRDDKP